MRSTLLCIGIIVFSLVFPPMAQVAHAGFIGAKAITSTSVANLAADYQTAMDPRSVDLSSNSIAAYDGAIATLQLSGFNSQQPHLQFNSVVSANAEPPSDQYSPSSALVTATWNDIIGYVPPASVGLGAASLTVQYHFYLSGSFSIGNEPGQTVSGQQLGITFGDGDSSYVQIQTSVDSQNTLDVSTSIYNGQSSQARFDSLSVNNGGSLTAAITITQTLERSTLNGVAGYFAPFEGYLNVSALVEDGFAAFGGDPGSFGFDSVTFLDGTTPESHGYTFLSASGMESPNAVPEPASWVTMALGVVGLSIFARYRLHLARPKAVSLQVESGVAS
jgi:hypothetical protein